MPPVTRTSPDVAGDPLLQFPELRLAVLFPVVIGSKRWRFLEAFFGCGFFADRSYYVTPSVRAEQAVTVSGQPEHFSGSHVRQVNVIHDELLKSQCEGDRTLRDPGSIVIAEEFSPFLFGIVMFGCHDKILSLI